MVNSCGPIRCAIVLAGTFRRASFSRSLSFAADISTSSNSLHSVPLTDETRDHCEPATGSQTCQHNQPTESNLVWKRLNAMADYAKRKNDELAALCKERGLPHGGKKADLVKRLEDYDASSTSAPAKPAMDDEIDWDDEPAADVDTKAAVAAATTEPAADALAAGGIGEIPNPQAVPNQIPVIDPAKTDELSVDPPAPAPEEEEELEKEEAKGFSTGLADRTIDEEIEKRKARARKFGLPEDNEEIKALERAKRFGTTDLPGLLNKALPGERERKRGREGDGDGGVRKRSRGPQRGRPGMGGRRGSGRRERTPGSGGGGASHPGWMSKEDREAVERRKAKFATTAS